MMLEPLGEAAAGRAIETLLRDGGPRTRDMGGQAGTQEVGKALAEIVARA
jgi:tartrate dehydrogenase/decarboxylase/D-malate dehydrogenase